MGANTKQIVFLLMKITAFLLRGTTFVVTALFLRVVLDLNVLSLFGFATGCFVLLTLIGDYTSRRPVVASSSRLTVRASRRPYSMPLAA